MQCVGQLGVLAGVAPPSPHRLDLSALGNLHNEIHVGVVAVVGAARHIDVFIRKVDVLGVGLHVFGRHHHHKLDGALVAKLLIRPLANRSDAFDSSDAIVGDENALNDAGALVALDKLCRCGPATQAHLLELGLAHMARQGAFVFRALLTVLRRRMHTLRVKVILAIL